MLRSKSTHSELPHPFYFNNNVLPFQTMPEKQREICFSNKINLLQFETKGKPHMGDRTKGHKMRKSTEMTHFCSMVTENKEDSGSVCNAKKYRHVIREMLMCLLKRAGFIGDWASSLQWFLILDEAQLSLIGQSSTFQKEQVLGDLYWPKDLNKTHFTVGLRHMHWASRTSLKEPQALVIISKSMAPRSCSLNQPGRGSGGAGVTCTS